MIMLLIALTEGFIRLSFLFIQAELSHLGVNSRLFDIRDLKLQGRLCDDDDD